MKKTIITTLLLLPLSLVGLSGCNSTQPRPAPIACDLPSGNDLNRAISQAKRTLSGPSCSHRYHASVEKLLKIAEGDPGLQNQQAFSDFFMWAVDRGLISKKQAQDSYNRYFNIKFMSLKGDYSTCSNVCPKQLDVMDAMNEELEAKRRGLMAISNDTSSFYRANRLFEDASLVLQATCSACAAED